MGRGGGEGRGGEGREGKRRGRGGEREGRRGVLGCNASQAFIVF